MALAGCGSDTGLGDQQMNKFLSDLSQAYLSDFKGPNPDDMIKIDFAVKRLVIDSPDAFSTDGKYMVVDADKVHAVSDRYFAYPIEADKFTNEVDDFKDGKYYYRNGNEQEFVFSVAGKVLGSKGDTVMVNAQTYSCKPGWKGNINMEPSSWESVDPDNVPRKGKNMRTVLLKKSDGFRVLSYTENKDN